MPILRFLVVILSATISLSALVACGPSLEELDAVASAGLAYQTAFLETAEASVEESVESESWDIALGLVSLPTLSGDFGSLSPEQQLMRYEAELLDTYGRLREVSQPLSNYFTVLQAAADTNQGEALAEELDSLSSTLSEIVERAGGSTFPIPSWASSLVEQLVSFAYRAEIAAIVERDSPLLVQALRLQRQISNELISRLERDTDSNLLTRLGNLNEALARSGSSVDTAQLVDARTSAVLELVQADTPSFRLSQAQTRLDRAMAAIVGTESPSAERLAAILPHLLRIAQ